MDDGICGLLGGVGCGLGLLFAGFVVAGVGWAGWGEWVFMER